MYLLKECNNILSANNYLDVEQVRNCIKTTTLGASLNLVLICLNRKSPLSFASYIWNIRFR